MEQNQTQERAAANVLLDRGVAFRLPAPGLFRLFGKRTIRITVRRLRLGTLVHLSTIAESCPVEPLKLPDESAERIIFEMGAQPMAPPIKAIVDNADMVTRKVAACLLNSPLKIKLFTGLLARHLRRHCSVDQLQELAMWLFIFGRAESFTNTTALLRRMTMMSPRTAGREKRS